MSTPPRIAAESSSRSAPSGVASSLTKYSRADLSRFRRPLPLSSPPRPAEVVDILQFYSGMRATSRIDIYWEPAMGLHTAPRDLAACTIPPAHSSSDRGRKRWFDCHQLSSDLWSPKRLVSLRLCSPRADEPPPGPQRRRPQPRWRECQPGPWSGPVAVQPPRVRRPPPWPPV